MPVPRPDPVASRAPSDKDVRWLLLAMFLCYLAMAMPLSSLAVQITSGWGMSNFLAGVATGAAFVATICCRKLFGDVADRRGGRYCFLAGCGIYFAGSILCFVAALDPLPVHARFAALILGRLVIGTGEAMANIGINHWSLALIPPSRIGRAMANIGMSVYLAIGVGGWTGYYLYFHGSFLTLLAVAAAAPLAGFAVAARLPTVAFLPAVNRPRITLPQAMARVWRFGFPSLLHSAGFGVLAAFLTKSFLDRDWPYSSLGLTLWGIGFVAMRMALGHLPDKRGGYLVARFSSAVAVAGLILLSLLAGPVLSLVGCFLTGAGASMVLPALMLENLRANPVEIRGAVISCYNICIDLAYAFTAPLAGLFVDRLGDRAAYILAAAAAAYGFFLIVRDGKRQAAGKEPAPGAQR